MPAGRTWKSANTWLTKAGDEQDRQRWLNMAAFWLNKAQTLEAELETDQAVIDA